MYAVIFRAQLSNDDKGYAEMSVFMRDIAFDKYNCIDLSACVDDGEEVAVSYWHSLKDIKAWREDTEHQAAQKLGQEKWLTRYKVEICEVLRAYSSDENSPNGS